MRESCKMMSLHYRTLIDGERFKRDTVLPSEGVDFMLGSMGGSGIDSEITEGPISITLRLRDQAGDELFFKVKPSTRMEKVIVSYSQRRGVSFDAVRFMLDGDRINADDTPDGLGLEDNDQIDIVLLAVGGGDDEAKPAAEVPITLKVRDQSGEELAFKVKKGTALRKVFQAYAQHKGIAVDALRFNFDGERVTEDQTPKMFEMEDGDQIDVLLDQTGGNGTEGETKTAADAPITLNVRNQTGEVVTFKVKKGTALRKIFQAYAQQMGVAIEVLRFMLDESRLNGDDTPKMHEMEDGDEIEVYLDQTGGGDDEAKPAAEVPITLKVRDQSGEELAFKVKKGTALRKVFQAYAQHKGIAVDALRFNFDGERVTEDQTPKMFEMEDGDQIDVLLDQTGGATVSRGVPLLVGRWHC